MSDGNTCKILLFDQSVLVCVPMDVSGLDIPDLRYMSRLLELYS